MRTALCYSPTQSLPLNRATLSCFHVSLFLLFLPRAALRRPWPAKQRCPAVQRQSHAFRGLVFTSLISFSPSPHNSLGKFIYINRAPFFSGLFFQFFFRSVQAATAVLRNPALATTKEQLLNSLRRSLGGLGLMHDDRLPASTQGSTGGLGFNSAPAKKQGHAATGGVGPAARGKCTGTVKSNSKGPPGKILHALSIGIDAPTTLSSSSVHHDQGIHVPQDLTTLPGQFDFGAQHCFAPPPARALSLMPPASSYVLSG